MRKIEDLSLDIRTLTLNEDNFRLLQQKYQGLCDELSKIELNNKDFVHYQDICSIKKYFVNQHDINSPTSRLSIVQSSINYIIDMLNLVLDTFFYEYKMVDTIRDKYGLTINNLSKKSFNINPQDEINKIISYFNEFTLFQDKIKEEDDLPNIKLLNIAYQIIKKLMQFYLSEDLTFKLLKTWEHIQGMIFPYDEDYRDHLIHQFYVFLLGATILSKLQYRIIDNWEISEVEKRSIDEKKRRTFRAWMSAALFHDIGYIAEKLNFISDDIFKRYFSSLPGLKCDKFNLKFNLTEPMFLKYLNYMDKVFAINEFQYYRKAGTKGIMHIIKREISELEHGTVSSYLFWNTILQDIKNLQPRPIQALPIITLDRLRTFNNIDTKKGIIDEIFKFGVDAALTKAKEEDQELHNIYIQEIEEDIDIATYAIAIHNIDNYPKVNFETHPLSFLLILCDELQQWGRIKIKNQKYAITPNELSSCKVYLMSDSAQTFYDDINNVTNLDRFTVFFGKSPMATLSSDIIIVRYEKIETTYLEIFTKKLDNIFNNRLNNGPSLIAINNNKIFFIAEYDGQNNYKTYSNQ